MGDEVYNQASEKAAFTFPTPWDARKSVQKGTDPSLGMARGMSIPAKESGSLGSSPSHGSQRPALGIVGLG